MVAWIFLIKFCIFGEIIIPYFLPKVNLLALRRVLVLIQVGSDKKILKKNKAIIAVYRLIAWFLCFLLVKLKAKTILLFV